MISQPSPCQISRLAEEIQFLARNARCPAIPRDILINWSEELEQRRPTVFEFEIIEPVIHALVTLSHSNAAFSRPAVPQFYSNKEALDANDTGGFFAARKVIATLIEIVPVSDEMRRKLAVVALSRIDHDVRALEKLIPY